MSSQWDPLFAQFEDLLDDEPRLEVLRLRDDDARQFTAGRCVKSSLAYLWRIIAKRTTMSRSHKEL